MQCTKEEFMQLLGYPREWLDYGMYPDELFEIQVQHYSPEHKEGAEHDRNGAFHWWLKKQPSKEQLLRIVKLSALDPDQLMGADVRTYLRKAASADSEVINSIDSLESSRNP